MKDSFENEIGVGDTVITIVSDGSHYLTTAKVIGEEDGKARIQYASTIKTKLVDLHSIPSLLYYPRPVELRAELELFRDGTNRVVEPGDTVAFKKDAGISFGVIKNIESNLWATLEEANTAQEIRVRNVQVIIIGR